jgi:hypothetical protein
MGTGYSRTSEASIVAGSTAKAGDVNTELNAVVAAMNGTTGHAHDGTTGNGPKIPLASSVTGTLPLANGGTGATTDVAARATLGIAIGTNIQAYSAPLTEIAGLTRSDNNFIVGNGIAWVAESGATARTSLGATTVGGALFTAADAGGARSTLELGSLATQTGTFSGTSSGTNTGDQNIFRTIAVSGQSDVVADTTTDTLTLAAGSGITITTNAGTDTVTIASTASTSSYKATTSSGAINTSFGNITGSWSSDIANAIVTLNSGAGTFTINSTGVYLISYTMYGAYSNPNTVEAEVALNGGAAISGSKTSILATIATNNSQGASFIASVTAADTVSISAKRSSGTGSVNASISIVKLS